jgi:hypothetical protein
VSSVTSSFRPRTSRPSAAVTDRVAANRARLGRIVLVVVVVLMASSYVRPAVDWLNARSAASDQVQRLEALRADAHRLEREKARLSTARGMTVAVRESSMVRAGERTYVVSNLPKD